MFLNLFDEMKSAKIPVSLREYLTFLEALTAGVAIFDVNDFYYLARTSLVKDERHIDRFDQVFSHVFKGLEAIEIEEVFKNGDDSHDIVVFKILMVVVEHSIHWQPTIFFPCSRSTCCSAPASVTSSSPMM